MFLFTLLALFQTNTYEAHSESSNRAYEVADQIIGIVYRLGWENTLENENTANQIHGYQKKIENLEKTITEKEEIQKSLEEKLKETKNQLEIKKNEKNNTEKENLKVDCLTNDKNVNDFEEKYRVALKVINGDYGNGKARENNLESLGYNHQDIQDIVNEIWYTVR